MWDIRVLEDPLHRRDAVSFGETAIDNHQVGLMHFGCFNSVILAARYRANIMTHRDQEIGQVHGDDAIVFNDNYAEISGHSIGP